MNRTDFLNLVGMFFEVCVGRKLKADEMYYDAEIEDDFRFSSHIGLCEDGKSISLIFFDSESGIEVKGCGADIGAAGVSLGHELRLMLDA